MMHKHEGAEAYVANLLEEYALSIGELLTVEITKFVLSGL
jgi:hypothetical protein